MNLADAFHALAVAGCRLTGGSDGGIAFKVPPGQTIPREVLDTLRDHRDEIAATFATASPASDLADYLAGKGISGRPADLVLHAAKIFGVRHHRITIEEEAAAPPVPEFFEPGIPFLTTADTEWNWAGSGLAVIPAGTLGLAIPQTWAIADDDERIGVEATLESLRRHKKPPHVPVWLNGRARALEVSLITFEGAVAPDGMNLVPWRPLTEGNPTP